MLRLRLRAAAAAADAYCERDHALIEWRRRPRGEEREKEHGHGLDFSHAAGFARMNCARGVRNHLAGEFLRIF